MDRGISSEGYVNFVAREGPYPSFCYTSGLTVYDEALIDGRLISRYWSCSGFIEPEYNLKEAAKIAHAPDATAGIDPRSFGLEADGQSLHFGWKLGDIRRDPKHAVIELESTLRPIAVRIHTQADGTGFLTRWLEIVNRGSEPSAIGAVWPWSGIIMRVRDWKELMGESGPVFTLGYMAERVWGCEGAFTWQPLPSTALRIESRMGRSGHGNPFFVVRNEATGECAIGALEWSGNWAMEFTCEQHGSSPHAVLGFQIGPVSPGPMRVLAPGETITSPRVHLALLHSDLDGCVQSWHRHLRRSVLPPQPEGRSGLVTYNHWGYWQHEMTEERLKFEIDVAAEIGAEVFVVDAGWFGNMGSDWWSTVGDWECGDRLPNGLEPVFEYARRRGLLCGLWLDAERIGPESRVAKEHPEWLLKRYGRETGTGDMDLTNPDCAEWLESKIVGLIERYRLDLFRLDYNTAPYEGGQIPRYGYMENSLWRYYEAVYGIYDRLRKRFPELILENCSSGGGRTDLGMLSRFHYTWITDWQMAPRSIRILNGMTLALPPERVDRNAGVAQNAHVRGDLDLQIRGTMFSHMTLTGIYPSPEERNPDHIARIKHHVDIYKSFIRPFLPECLVYHHTPVLAGREPRGWCVLEYISADRSCGAVGLFRLAGPSGPEYHLRLRGVDAGRRYRVTFDNSGSEAEFDGERLRTTGISVTLNSPMSSELLLLREV